MTRIVISASLLLIVAGCGERPKEALWLEFQLRRCTHMGGSGFYSGNGKILTCYPVGKYDKKLFEVRYPENKNAL